MFTKQQIKTICLKAWLHEELEYAERKTLLQQGIQVVEDEKVKFLRENGNKLLKAWFFQGCTKKNINQLQKKFKFFKKYYNQIHSSIEYIIKKFPEQDLKNNWIPLYLALAICKRSSEYRFNVLPIELNNIDIDEMIKAYISSNDIPDNIKAIYWKLCRKILEDLEKL
ncbi:hypothetical protein [Aliarcobacter cibarius]|uniref:Uncharacterized protein n=1 Tax=Aliarcobacter cibarius TaxID=255507 RepID=A0ABY2V8Q0_9BACT|nr:hypothetical protein [Aliarcobacter cibarius]TLS99899.1 hypothetical protein FE247_05050 [Aliarcobacter cibarius]TLT00308.1 hypothetical protein FE245_05480 [Aliarcobacter cibarius]